MKKSEDAHKDKKKAPKSPGSNPNKYIAVVAVLFITTVVLAVVFTFASQDNGENIEQDQKETATAEEPEPENDVVSAGDLLESYIEEAENEELSRADRLQSYMNAAVLAADMNDNRAQSLAQKALDLFDEDSLNDQENADVVSLVRSIAEGTYDPDSIDNIQVEGR